MQTYYKIKRLEDGKWYCKDGEWRSDAASFFTEAKAGTLLGEFPNGMKDGYYKLVPGKRS